MKRRTQIEVNVGNAVVRRLHTSHFYRQLRCFECKLRVITAELNHERFVIVMHLEHLRSVRFVFDEKSTVEHGRIRHLRAVFLAQHSKCKLTLVYHGCDNILGAAKTASALNGVIVRTTGSQ